MLVAACSMYEITNLDICNVIWLFIPNLKKREVFHHTNFVIYILIGLAETIFFIYETKCSLFFFKTINLLLTAGILTATDSTYHIFTAFDQFHIKTMY